MHIILKTLSIATRLLASGHASAATPSDTLYGPDPMRINLISPDRAGLIVDHGGRKTTILRHPDPANTIAARYAISVSV